MPNISHNFVIIKIHSPNWSVKLTSSKKPIENTHENLKIIQIVINLKK